MSDIYLSEYEPLGWLVSTLFTDEFLDRRALTASRLNFGLRKDPAEKSLADLYVSDDPEDPFIISATYPTYQSLYEAIEKYILVNEEAASLYNQAKAQVEAGNITPYSPKVDEWGEATESNDLYKVDTYEFLLWADGLGRVVNQRLMPSIRFLIQGRQQQQAAEERFNHEFPKIDPAQFATLKKEPVWLITDAILYVYGVRKRHDKVEIKSFFNRNPNASKLLGYCEKAKHAGHLKTLAIGLSETIDTESVEPDVFVEWARGLPLNIPLIHQEASVVVAKSMKAYSPDVRLMLDAIDKFWGSYDMSQPNPNVAPFKKDVVEWLVEEARRRSLADFSETRANHIDSIMRCPQARKGGNTQ